MLKTKPILKFLLVFVLVYGILIAAFPLLRDQTGIYISNLGNKFLHSPAHNALVSFYKTSEKLDVEILVGNITQEVNGSVLSFREKLNSYGYAYLPTALLIALVIASPVSMKRKLLSLTFSILFLHMLLLFRMYIQILHICNQNISLNLINPGPFFRNFIDWMHAYFVGYGVVMLFVVVFIWLAVTFRKEDLSLIRSASRS